MYSCYLIARWLWRWLPDSPSHETRRDEDGDYRDISLRQQLVEIVSLAEADCNNRMANTARMTLCSHHDTMFAAFAHPLSRDNDLFPTEPQIKRQWARRVDRDLF